MRRLGARVVLGVLCGACSPDTGASSFPGNGGGATGFGGDTGFGGADAGSGGGGSIGASTKMDVVLVVDNSAFMTEMQDQLANTVPALVTTLTGKVQDLRIGVITTSLGGHGSTVCSGSSTPLTAEEQDD